MGASTVYERTKYFDRMQMRAMASLQTAEDAKQSMSKLFFFFLASSGHSFRDMPMYSSMNLATHSSTQSTGLSVLREQSSVADRM